MPKKQFRLNFTDGELAVLTRQQELGRYRSLGNTIEALVSRYQESFTSHLESPYLPRKEAVPPQLATVSPYSESDLHQLPPLAASEQPNQPPDFL
jgi:hypothetical protein